MENMCEICLYNNPENSLVNSMDVKLRADVTACKVKVLPLQAAE